MAADVEARPIRAIVIEDDTDLRNAFVETLNHAPGITATSAENIVDGTITAMKEPSLVVLVDLGLSDARREEAVVVLKNKVPMATIVVVTGADDDVQQAALAAGAHAVIQKGGPHSFGEGLISTIREAVLEHESQLRFKPLTESLARIQKIVDQVKDRNSRLEAAAS